MARLDPSHLVVGHLAKPHGTGGEILVSPLTDHPESVFAPGVVLLLGNPEDDVPDPDLPPLRVEGARPVPRGVLVRFGGVDDRNQAEILSGRYLFQSIEALEPLAEGELFFHQLLGLVLETTEGEEVGRVRQIYDLAPTAMLEVVGERGGLLIPYRPEIVVAIDLDEGRLVIDPPEGLLDLAAG